MRRSTDDSDDEDDDDDQLGFSFSSSAAGVNKPALAAAAPPVPVRKVWPIRELVSLVRGRVERDFSDVWFEGEMSNYRPASSGHLYFTIKEGDAQIKVVIFRSAARLLRFQPENGMVLIGRGRVTVYEARGELQIIADYLEPKGEGALQVAFEQLKAKLAAEGLFDAARKRPVPRIPRAIGIVTSPTGAAIQDILNILRRRHEDVHIMIYPAQVQGEAAAAEVAAGIRYFNRSQSVEVIIVTRGGGPIEDLAAFNDESLARAIAASGLPVISAVGHEIDFTIADFVADLRAPTPSAAAELVMEAKQQLASAAANYHERLRNAMRYRLIMAKQRAERLGGSAVFERMRHLVQVRQQRVDELLFRLSTSERSRVQGLRQRLELAQSRVLHHDLGRALAAHGSLLARKEQRLSLAFERLASQRRGQIERLQTQLDALSPLRVLDRGYALVFDSAGSLIRGVEQVAQGSLLTTRLHDGEFRSTVSETQTNPESGESMRK